MEQAPPPRRQHLLFVGRHHWHQPLPRQHDLEPWPERGRVAPLGRQFARRLRVAQRVAAVHGHLVQRQIEGGRAEPPRQCLEFAARQPDGGTYEERDAVQRRRAARGGARAFTQRLHGVEEAAFEARNANEVALDHGVEALDLGHHDEPVFARSDSPQQHQASWCGQTLEPELGKPRHFLRHRARRVHIAQHRLLGHHVAGMCPAAGAHLATLHPQGRPARTLKARCSVEGVCGRHVSQPQIGLGLGWQHGQGLRQIAGRGEQEPEDLRAGG